jgi:hypothetical protein
MTPYGTEWSVDNYVRANRRLMKISVRVGDTGTSTAWGLGVRGSRMAERGRLAVDLSADVWRQPPIDAPAPTPVLRTGGLAAATTRVALGDSQKPGRVGLVGEVGYKSDGFVRGERLRSGPVVRVGLTLALDRDR